MKIEINEFKFWDWEIAEKIGKFEPNNSCCGNVIFQYVFPFNTKIGKNNERQTMTMQVVRQNKNQYKLNCYGWSDEAYKSFEFTEQGYAEAIKYINEERIKYIKTLCKGE